TLAQPSVVSVKTQDSLRLIQTARLPTRSKPARCAASRASPDSYPTTGIPPHSARAAFAAPRHADSRSRSTSKTFVRPITPRLRLAIAPARSLLSSERTRILTRASPSNSLRKNGRGIGDSPQATSHRSSVLLSTTADQPFEAPP